MKRLIAPSGFGRGWLKERSQNINFSGDATEPLDVAVLSANFDPSERAPKPRVIDLIGGTIFPSGTCISPA
jgi:hypothetical protein